MPVRSNPARPPDQRYLRRRANRRVRKRRRLRTLLRRTAVVALHLTILVVLALGVRRAMQYATTSPYFALREFSIEGVERGSVETLRARLEPLRGRNLLTLELRSVALAAERDPWVRTASVKRVLPDGLRVLVTERRPAAVAVIHGLAHLVDEQGFVIGPSGPGRADDLPVLTGLEGLGDAELASALARGVGAATRLARANPRFAAMVSEIDLARTDQVRVVTIEPGPALLLDPQRVERNVAPFLARREELERRVGPLRTVDLRWNERIAVTPVLRPVFLESGQ